MTDAASAAPRRLLALSGSLRARSSTATLLAVAARVAPAGVAVEFAPSIATLPHFNPDLDGEGAEPPPAVAAFRAALREADGVLLCTPEYIHGVPGALKNAIDWTAGTGEFDCKPVALVNPSVASFHAQESLRETLTTLMARVILARVPIRGNQADPDVAVLDPALVGSIRGLIAQLVDLIEQPEDPDA